MVILTVRPGRHTVRAMIRRAMVLLMVIAVAAAPAAAETVLFPSATTPPTPLQQRLAQERGEAIPIQATQQISGQLYRPAGEGPFPAIVALHGCGNRSHALDDALGGAVEADPPVDRVMDAYGALQYLAGLPFIDGDRIAVLGFSQGAMINSGYGYAGYGYSGWKEKHGRQSQNSASGRRTP